MDELPDGAVLILPAGGRDTRDTLVFGNLVLVDGDLGELARGLIPLDRVGAESG